MAEDAPKESVLKEDFDRFVKAKIPSLACPLCAQDGFTLLVSEKKQPPQKSPVVELSIATRASTAGAAFGIYCSNCGHVLTFRDVIVRRWLSQNPTDPVAG